MSGVDLDLAKQDMTRVILVAMKVLEDSLPGPEI